MLARLGVLLVATCSMMAYVGDAESSHPYPGSGQLNIDYLHSELEPGGDGRVTYRLCDDVQRGVPWEWENGVEKWDTALGTSFEFDPVTSCSVTADGSTILRWEIGEQCGFGYLACWHTYTNGAWYAPH